MQFFLYEIVARVVAIYVGLVTFRTLRSGCVERKIRLYTGGDLLNALLMGNRIIHRDTAPVAYWITIGLNMFALVGCIGVAIFGWWHPDT
jgi:hypothetical protein